MDDVTNNGPFVSSDGGFGVSCTSSSESQNQYSDDGVCYTLSELQLSDLNLRNEQQQAIYAVYGEKNVCLPTGEGESVWFQTLPFLFDHKCVWIGCKKRICAIIITRLIALMVD